MTIAKSVPRDYYPHRNHRTKKTAVNNYRRIRDEKLRKKQLLERAVDNSPIDNDIEREYNGITKVDDN